jgi:hypothetical protein
MRMRMGAAMAAVGGLAVGLAVAQPQRKPGDKPPAPQQPSQEQMQEMMGAKPGPEHERLAKLAGNFTIETTYTGMGPEPQKSTGEATAAMTLGGRFLEIRETGKMGPDSMEAVQIWGFNNGSKKYESIWRYTMSTAIMAMRGRSADGGTTIECEAHYDDATGKPVTMNVRFLHESDERFTIELTSKDDTGHEVRMESVYSRKP